MAAQTGYRGADDVIRVGHLLGQCIAQTETFIWQYLRSFRGVEAVAFSQQLVNEQQFPLPQVTRVTLLIHLLRVQAYQDVRVLVWEQWQIRLARSGRRPSESVVE